MSERERGKDFHQREKSKIHRSTSTKVYCDSQSTIIFCVERERERERETERSYEVKNFRIDERDFLTERERERDGYLRKRGRRRR